MPDQELTCGDPSIVSLSVLRLRGAGGGPQRRVHHRRGRWATPLTSRHPISASIEKELGPYGWSSPSTFRIGGANRYETSRLIDERWQPWQLVDTTCVASGEYFADALSGTTAAAAEGLQISLSRPDCVPVATADSLERNRIDTAEILGSERTLSRAVSTVTLC